ncbi:MAG: 3-deoxy-7-phosphoheptulonate synthase [Bacteroidia bacterium]
MIIELQQNIKPDTLHQLKALLTLNQVAFTHVEKQNIIVAPKISNQTVLTGIDGIEKVIELDTPFQLSSKEYKKETHFLVNGTSVGSQFINLIAGPCSVESEEQIYTTAEFLSKNGIKFIRGGAYKPRTSPYAFRGLGLDGLKILRNAANEFKLNVITELMDLSLLDQITEYSDIIQIGSRNMSNFYMLAELGKTDKPIMLKRGMSARLSEWLLAADYILSGGNEKVLLCERGIRSFDPEVRNTMDVAAIPMIQALSHLPVFADPSHGTGMAKFVHPLSLASLVAGANGLMIEIHPDPSKSLSDAQQAMSFQDFEILVQEIRKLEPAINKPIDATYEEA